MLPLQARNKLWKVQGGEVNRNMILHSRVAPLHDSFLTSDLRLRASD